MENVFDDEYVERIQLLLEATNFSPKNSKYVVIVQFVLVGRMQFNMVLLSVHGIMLDYAKTNIVYVFEL